MSAPLPRAGRPSREPELRSKLFCSMAQVLALYVVALGLALAAGRIPPDESWFLQVVNRLRHGEILYREVFCGITPLSVYVTWFFSKLFGLQLIVERAIIQACFVATVLLVLKICRQLGMPAGYQWPLAAALLVYGQDRASTTPYSPMAMVFMLLCFSLALMWFYERIAVNSAATGMAPGWVTPGLAGLGAGLCFATKQNAGMLTLAALLATVLIVSVAGHTGAKKALALMAVMFAGFLLASSLVLFPVYLTGGIPGLLDYGFLGKGAYLQHGGDWAAFRVLSPAMLLTEPGNPTAWKCLYMNILYLAPAIAASLLLVAWLRCKGTIRTLTLVVAVFTGAVMLLAFPRADATHMVLIFPALMPAIVHGWQAARLPFPPRFEWLFRALVWAWLGVGLGFLVLRPVAGLERGNYCASPFPCHQGVLITPAMRAYWESQIQSLRRSAPGKRLFILAYDAGFYYLTLGLQNPTPFDVPAATAFGRHGQKEVIAAIQQGKISEVCWKQEQIEEFEPDTLVQFIRANMVQGPDAGPCTLYSLPAVDRALPGADLNAPKR